jgi:hypothetical protein
MNQDIEHLRLLSIFHYVVAGLGALFACFPVIHLVIGLTLAFAPGVLEHGPKGNPVVPQFVGLLFATFAAAMILAGWTVSFGVFLAGRFLGQHRHYTFCLIVACILCLMFPFGTVLGVFTLIVLLRPSVKTLFGQPAGPPFGGP